MAEGAQFHFARPAAPCHNAALSFKSLAGKGGFERKGALAERLARRGRHQSASLRGQRVREAATARSMLQNRHDRLGVARLGMAPFGRSGMVPFERIAA